MGVLINLKRVRRSFFAWTLMFGTCTAAPMTASANATDDLASTRSELPINWLS